ncbi:MAG: hypothetical protein AAF604_11640 [Acidobacteriota bacterium]
MRWLDLLTRFALAAIFIVFGLNGFFKFLPVPELQPDAASFIGLLIGSGYMKVVKLIEIIGGILLLVNRRPLGLTLLGPVVVNIMLFHLLFDPASMAPGVVVLVLWAFQMWRHWGAFAGLLKAGQA